MLRWFSKIEGAQCVVADLPSQTEHVCTYCNGLTTLPNSLVGVKAGMIFFCFITRQTSGQNLVGTFVRVFISNNLKNVWMSDKSWEPGMFWKTWKPENIKMILGTCWTAFVSCLVPSLQTLGRARGIIGLLGSPKNTKFVSKWLKSSHGRTPKL